MIHLRKALIRISIRLAIVFAILMGMLILIGSLLSSYEASYGHPEQGKMILLSFFIMIIGLIGILVACLYKSRWIEEREPK